MALISPNFDVKSIFFPNFGQGPFPKIAGKGPGKHLSFLNATSIPLCIHSKLLMLAFLFKTNFHANDVPTTYDTEKELKPF